MREKKQPLWNPLNGKDVRNLLFISLMVKREARKKKKKHYSKIMVLKKECQQYIKERIQNKRNKKLGKKKGPSHFIEP